MALVVDSTTDGGWNAGSTATHSWSHTCSGSNRVLVVSASVGNSTDNLTATYNGVSMTKFATDTSGGAIRAYLFYLIAPATGTNTVSLSRTGNSNIGGSSISFTGADQTTPLTNATTANGTGTTASISVTTATGNYIVDSVYYRQRTATSVQGTNYGNTQYSGDGSTEGAHYIAYSSSPQTMSWTATSNNWAIAGASVAPAAGGAVNYAPMMMVSD